MPRAGSRRARRSAGHPRVGGASAGILLCACRPQWAIAWAKRGLGPLTVATVQGWTLVAPAGPPMARPPYDDPVRTLAGRPVGLGMRPAIGLFTVGRQAVVTVHAARWRSVHRWAVWTPREALVTMPEFAPARPRDMVAVASASSGMAVPGAEPALRELWLDGSVDAGTVLTGTFRLLGLPGRELLDDADPGELPGARRIDPKERHARAFDKVLAELAREREEREA